MLNAYFFPEQIAFTHLENDLLEAFVDKGFEIDLVTPIPTRGIDNDTSERYASVREEILFDGHVKVHRFWAPQEGKNPIVRAFRYIWCNLREYQLGKKYRATDVIFVPSTPPTQGWMAGKVKNSIQKHGNKDVRLVYNLQDVFPDSLINAGMAKKGSFIWRIGRWVEDKTYEYSDEIITISNDFKVNLIEKGVCAGKITVVQNWIDSEKMKPVSRDENKLFERYGLDRSKFYICYSGNIGHSQNIPLIVNTAIRLEERTADILFIIFGDGAAREELELLIREKKLINICLLPFQPESEISSVYSLGDVGLIISKKGIGKSSVPSKTWSIMSVARPILASFDKESELSKIINEAKCGFVIDPDDIDDFETKIMDLYNDKEQTQSMGLNARKFVIENRDKNGATKKYIEVLSGKKRG